MIRGIDLVAAERSKQIAKGYDVFHDSDEFHQNGEMAMAAVFALTGDKNHYPKNWNKDYAEKLVCKHDLERNIISAALLIAEIDRKLTQLRHNGYTDEMIADMDGLPKIIGEYRLIEPPKAEENIKDFKDELTEMLLHIYSKPDNDDKSGYVINSLLTTFEILTSLSEEYDIPCHDTNLRLLTQILKENNFHRIAVRLPGYKCPVKCWAVKRIR